MPHINPVTKLGKESVVVKALMEESIFRAAIALIMERRLLRTNRKPTKLDDIDHSKHVTPSTK